VNEIGPSFGTPEDESAKEQAVIVSIKLSNDGFGSEAEEHSLAELEAEIGDCLRGSEAGEWEGHETGGGYHKIFLFGPDADVLSETVLPTVMRFEARSGSYLVKRFGEVGSDEQYIWLDSEVRA
jgi:hypothetical protein